MSIPNIHNYDITPAKAPENSKKCLCTKEQSKRCWGIIMCDKKFKKTAQKPIRAKKV